MSRLLRAPLLHFFLIGGMLFAADRLVADSLDAARSREPVGEVSEGSAPLGVEEVLVREARARGYHRIDPIVRRRLLRNLRFLEDDAGRSDADLFDEALALGMDRSDPVVRRRLAQLVTLGIEADARRDTPSESELEAYLASHRERFAEPERIRLTQVFLSRDLRGDATLADARALLERLVAEGVPPERAAEAGDPLLLASAQPLRSEAELARVFGPDFPRGAFGARQGGWSGPVASSYGLHLVWVHERSPARTPDLAAVRTAVLESLLADRASAAVREAVKVLRAGSRVDRGDPGGREDRDDQEDHEDQEGQGDRA